MKFIYLIIVLIIYTFLSLFMLVKEDKLTKEDFHHTPSLFINLNGLLALLVGLGLMYANINFTFWSININQNIKIATTIISSIGLFSVITKIIKINDNEIEFKNHFIIFTLNITFIFFIILLLMSIIIRVMNLL